MCCCLVSCRQWPSPVETCRLQLHICPLFFSLLFFSFCFLGKLKVIEHASRRRRCRSLCSRATTLKSEAESRQASARAKGGGSCMQNRIMNIDLHPTILSLSLSSLNPGNNTNSSSLLALFSFVSFLLFFPSQF